MLDSMRGVAKGFVAKALMIFLVITFAVWGAGDVVRGGSSSTLVKVGDEKITPNQFVSEQRSMQQSLEAMGARNVDPRALQNEILRRMVQQKLVMQWQKDTGLRVDQRTLAQEIASAGEFKGINGKFDPKLFEMTLQQRRMSEKQYLASLSEEIGGKAMLASLDVSDAGVPKTVAELAVASGTQLRDAVLITVPVVRVAPNAVSAEDAQVYYEQNQDDFAQPERRTLEYILLDSASLKKRADAAVTDEATAVEQREQAVQEIAMGIEDGLAAGSAMGEAVAEAGIQSQSKMLSDITSRQFMESTDEVLRQVAQQGFEMGEDETSALLSTQDGRYFMVHVKDVKQAAPKEFAEVESEVRAQAATEQSREETQARVQEVKKALLAGKTAQEAAVLGKAQTRTVNGIGRPVTGADGKVKEDARIPALLQQAVFEHKVGGVAGPMVRANGEQVLALVTGLRVAKNAADAKAFTEAQAAYKAQLGDAVSNDVFRHLAQRYPVVVNQKMLAQLQNSEQAQ